MQEVRTSRTHKIEKDMTSEVHNRENSESSGKIYFDNAESCARSAVANIDCLEYMRTLPDNYFQLAIADPPYGINIGNGLGSGKKQCKMHHEWQFNAPGQEFFDELFRVSEEQIIWGGQLLSIANLRQLDCMGQTESESVFCRG